MASNLRVSLRLPKGWFDHSKRDSGGPSLYYRHTSKYPGALQVSLAEYMPGKIPNMNSATLISVAKNLGSNLGQVVEETTGKCSLGDLGSVLFHSDRVTRAQVWCLTDGHVAVLVTHICEKPPDPAEIDEVQTIVQNLTVTEGAQSPKIRHWWQFWKR